MHDFTRVVRGPKLFSVSLLVCLLCLSVPAAKAETLFQVSGGQSGGNLGISTAIVGPNVYGQWLGESFALSETFSNVTITPSLGYYSQFGDFHGVAWLVDPLPTTNAPISSASFTLSGDPSVSPRALLSGLTLGPGTYYFLLTGDPGASGYSGEAVWPNMFNYTVTTAPGVAAGSLSFVPGDGFDLAYPPNSGWYTYSAGYLPGPIRVTGDRAVPEPGTAALLGLGFVLLAARRRSRD